MTSRHSVLPPLSYLRIQPSLQSWTSFCLLERFVCCFLKIPFRDSMFLRLFCNDRRGSRNRCRTWRWKSEAKSVAWRASFFKQCNKCSFCFVPKTTQVPFKPAKSIYSVNAGVSLHDRYCACFVPGSVLVKRLTNTSSNAFPSVTSLLSEGTTLPKYLPENVRGVSPNWKDCAC